MYPISISLLLQITSLAIKLHPGNPTRWPDWLRASINALSSMGVPREHMLDFLAIVAEEMESADLLPANKFVTLHHDANV